MVNANKIPYFFDENKLTDEDLKILSSLISNNNYNEALDIFINDYILPASYNYSDELISELYLSIEDQLSINETNKLTRNTTLLTISFISFLSYNFKLFSNIYSYDIFNKNSLKNYDVQKSIMKKSLSTFNELIQGSLQNTQSFVVNGIRSIQKEIITNNYILNKSDLSQSEILRQKNIFKKGLRKKYPYLYNAIDNGNVLTTKNYTESGELIRHYKLEYYLDLFIRKSIMDIDRDTVETVAILNNERVVEYYLFDIRNVKKDREICKKILSNKVNGKSLLALDTDIAKKLNIMTITEAKTTPDFAMGPYCRHSFKRLDKSFLNEIGAINDN